MGSGKEELCKALFGITRLDAGSILIDDKPVTLHSPISAFRKGIGYVPEDRRNEALVLNLPVFENLTLTVLRTLVKYGLIVRKRQLKLTGRMISELSIKTPSGRTPCKNLSGGNQQKIVIGKWLLSGVKVLIMSHPTRGVDVGAKQQIYALMRSMVKQGMALILMGDSFEEDIGLSNTILVMKDGRVTAKMDATESKPTPADLIRYVV